MLERIFLSYHFDEEAKKLAAKLENLVRSFNLITVTGEHVGGEKLSDKIKKDIANCDALIFVLSKRDEGKTNEWVMDEISTAKTLNIPFIGLVEDGVSFPTPLVGREYIKYNTMESSDLWLKLCATINIWTKSKGRSIFATIQPKLIAQKLRGFKNLNALTVEYQLQDSKLNKTEWKPGKITKTHTGVSVLLDEVLDETFIILKISTPEITWESIPINQEIVIKLS